LTSRLLRKFQVSVRQDRDPLKTAVYTSVHEAS
jgi:hypothetical protein